MPRTTKKTETAGPTPAPTPAESVAATAPTSAETAPPQTPAEPLLTGLEEVTVEFSVETPTAVMLVYDGDGPRTFDLGGRRLTVWPGALLQLPLVGEVKALVSERVLRRLG